MNQLFSSAPPLIAECKDTSEKIDLYEKYGLYIKPIARLNITIQLPPMKNPGQAVPTNDVLDKVKKISFPDEFIYLRVIKSTLEFIRCEGEIENKSAFKTLLSKLDGCTIKMNSYTDVLKIRAAEAKLSYPTRHDWETFFKDSSIETSVIEMKPGERPDTIHLADIPCKWFADKLAVIAAAYDYSSIKPNEDILKEVFSFFGEIRMIDIPILTNPILLCQSLSVRKHSELMSGLNSSNPNLNLNTFEAFIQYKDYISFVKAMDAFRGMKMLYIDKESHEAYTANIRVDFDRTKHLSDKEIKKREIDKLKAIEIEKIKNATIEKEKEKEAKQKEIATYRLLLEESTDDGKKSDNSEEKSKEQRRREREEARRQKKIAKKQQEEEKKLEMKIALEERKILIAQRKLESMRLLEELFNRVKVIFAQEELQKREKEIKEFKLKRKQEEENLEFIKKLKQEQDEQELRQQLDKKLNQNSEENQDNENSDYRIEEFELRKDTLPNFNQLVSPEKISASSSKDYCFSSHSSTHVMPRAVLLSNVQSQQSKNKSPKLYDDEEILSVSNSIETSRLYKNQDDDDTGEIFDNDELIQNKSHRDGLSSGEISAENSIDNTN